MTYALETDQGWFSLRRRTRRARFWMFEFWALYDSNGELLDSSVDQYRKERSRQMK